MTSTINPNIPALNSALVSPPIQQNFLAAYNDINGIQTILAGLGNMSTQSQNNVTITGGNIAGSALNAGSVPNSAMAAGTANTLAGYNNSGAFSGVTVGSGLSLSGSTLSSTVAAGVSSVSNSDGSLTINPTTGAVVASIATSGVGTNQIANNAVTNAKMATSSPNTLAGYNNSGNFSTVALGSNLSLVSGVLSATGGGGGAVSSVANSDGTLTVSPTTGSVIVSLASLTNGNVLIGNVSNIATQQAISGDGNLSNTGALTITKTQGVAFAQSATTNALNASNINAGSLALARIASLSNNSVLGNVSGGNASPIGLNTTQLNNLISFPNALVSSVTGSSGVTANPTTGNVSVTLSTISNNSILGNVSGSLASPIGLNTSQLNSLITFPNALVSSVTNTDGTLKVLPTAGNIVVSLASLTNGNILIGNASNIATQQTMSGDGTLSNTGSLTVISTQGHSFAASATTNALNASNINSGSLALARLASVSNNSIICNISGASNPPSAFALTSILDTEIGSAQGELIYRGASSWTALTAGTSGQVLATGGVGGNPNWTTVTGTGTVTSVTFTGDGTVLSNTPSSAVTTAGTVTATLANAPAANVLINNSNVAAAPAYASTMTLGTGNFSASAGTVAIQQTGNTNNYFQIALQNTNSGSSASTDFIATANDGNDTTHYADFGINSSGGGGAPFTNAHAAYVYSSDNELDLVATGASGAVKIYTTGGSNPTLAATFNSSQVAILQAAPSVTTFTNAGFVTNTVGGTLQSTTPIIAYNFNQSVSANGNILLAPYVPFGCTIANVFAIAANSGGSCTAAIQIGTTSVSSTASFTNIGGLSAIAVTSTPGNATATSANTVVASNSLNLMVSAASNLSTLYFTIAAARTS